LSAIAKVNNISVKADSFLPSGYKPFTYLKNLITAEDVPKIREFFATCPVDPFAKGSDYKSVVTNERLYLPSLENRLRELFPDLMVFSTNFFSGDKPKGEYSGWHTGVNLSKVFIGEPDTCTVWIPLQTLTAETGGRLWFYNGEYLDSIVDMLKVTNKLTHAFQYIMLALLEKELETNKVTGDCQFGDGFMFREVNPHCVDRDCNIPRDVLSVRLISRTAVVDDAFFKTIENLPEGEPINLIENKDILMRLYRFITGTRDCFEKSLAFEKEREKNNA